MILKTQKRKPARSLIEIRTFFSAALFFTCAPIMTSLAGARSTQANANEIAITIDDPETEAQPTMSAEQMDKAILSSLSKAKVEAALFVCGKRIDSAEGKALLNRWSKSGHLIGNHSYSHLNFNSAKTSFETYSEDIIRGESLLLNLPGFQKLFRFPFLKEGESAKKRDRIRKWLQEQNYRSGAVTVDTSEWYISERMKKRLQNNAKADTRPYRDYYLNHIWDRIKYYDNLSKKVVGKPIKHTLLLHHNILNAYFLDDLIRDIKSKGWKIIRAREAFSDPIFIKQPSTVPAGESLVWGLARDTGEHEAALRHPGESDEYQKEEMDQLGL